MSLRDTFTASMKEAMKSGDKARLSVVRMIQAAAAALREFDECAHAGDVRAGGHQHRPTRVLEDLGRPGDGGSQINGFAIHQRRGDRTRVCRKHRAAFGAAVRDYRRFVVCDRHTQVIAQQSAKRTGHIVDFPCADNVRHFVSAIAYTTQRNWIPGVALRYICDPRAQKLNTTLP